MALDKYESQYRLNIEEYLDSILFTIPKVQNWVALNYCRLDNQIISKVIQAAKNVKEKVDFDNSSLKIDDEPEFGTEEYKLSKLTMEDSFIK